MIGQIHAPITLSPAKCPYIQWIAVCVGPSWCFGDDKNLLPIPEFEPQLIPYQLRYPTYYTAVTGI
jgi:hypothetical protein